MSFWGKNTKKLDSNLFEAVNTTVMEPLHHCKRYAEINYTLLKIDQTGFRGPCNTD